MCVSDPEPKSTAPVRVSSIRELRQWRGSRRGIGLPASNCSDLVALPESLVLGHRLICSLWGIHLLELLSDELMIPFEFLELLLVCWVGFPPFSSQGENCIRALED